MAPILPRRLAYELPNSSLSWGLYRHRYCPIRCRSNKSATTRELTISAQIEQSSAGVTRIELTLPLRTVSEANRREHWGA